MLLSILAVVDVENIEQAGHDDDDADAESQGCGSGDEGLVEAHAVLRTLSAAVRAWRPTKLHVHDVDARDGEDSDEGDGGDAGSGMTIEMLVAASCCRCRSGVGEASDDASAGRCCKTASIPSTRHADRKEECLHEHLVRNSLLDAAGGRFVIWAVPGHITTNTSSAWLDEMVELALLQPSLMSANHVPQMRVGVAHEWETSVIEALTARYPDFRSERCSWSVVGPMLRPVASLIRFREVLPEDDDAGVHSEDPALWSVRLPFTNRWHLDHGDGDVEGWSRRVESERRLHGKMGKYSPSSPPMSILYRHLLSSAPFSLSFSLSLALSFALSLALPHCRSHPA